MKFPFRATLLSGLAALICSACSPNQDVAEEVADAPIGENGGPVGEEGPLPIADEGEGQPLSPQDNVVANRLRLPDMENLPSEQELTSNKANNAGSGVIARPPSE